MPVAAIAGYEAVAARSKTTLLAAPGANRRTADAARPAEGGMLAFTATTLCEESLICK